MSACDPKILLHIAFIWNLDMTPTRPPRLAPQTRQAILHARRIALFSMLTLVFAPSFALASPVYQCGKASWYALGGITASGERADANALTAAHRTLPFGTKVRVHNMANGKSVTVRINDRGPFVRGRVIDVTKAAAHELGFIRKGVTRVRVEMADGAPLDGGTACAD